MTAVQTGAGRGGDPVPAVREDEATGRVAERFAELRATLGVPMVNLVWRHLATDPEALDWTWATVRPLYESGALAAETVALHGRMALPPLPAMPGAVLRAAGLGAADEAGIAAVLASYDRGNTMNLLAFSTVLRRLEGGAPVAGTWSTLAAKPVAARLPRLLVAAEMEPAAGDLVLRLNALGHDDTGPIVASLYRHLAHWPPYLALAWALLAPLDAQGLLRPAIAATRAAAAARGAVLVRGLAEPPDPGPAARAFAQRALATFRDHGIPRMVTIGRILRAAMPATA
ncbi:MAG: hypothetical protein IT561_27495 [Alphaproteobacteria bacterium]|nr:hypothetical protein [Alphaproteobacteria bacterium]